MLEESSKAIVDTGTWSTAALSGAYGGSVQYANAAGRKATFTVPVGTKNVGWVSTKATNRGLTDVYLDGAFQKRVDLYSTTSQPRSVVFSKAVNPATTHKLEVRVLGQKNVPSTGTRVDVDAFLSTG